MRQGAARNAPGQEPAADRLLDEAREPLAMLGGRTTVHEDGLPREGLTSGARARQVPRTAAETRVLRVLPTPPPVPRHRRPAAPSRFTVTSQALAVYRTLGVSSLGAAVARARVLGLLDDEPRR